MRVFDIDEIEGECAVDLLFSAFDLTSYASGFGERRHFYYNAPNALTDLSMDRVYVAMRKRYIIEKRVMACALPKVHQSFDDFFDQD